MSVKSIICICDDNDEAELETDASIENGWGLFFQGGDGRI